MATVTVRRNAFEFGEFPPVCCKTGERASIYARWEFKGGRYAGVLPFSTVAMRRVKNARRAVWVWGVVAIALAVAAVAVGSRLAVPAVGLAGVTGFYLALVWMWSPGAKLHEGSVELTRVHRNFADAVTASTEPAPPPQAEATEPAEPTEPTPPPPPDPIG
jgi:hypothetical protein